MSIDITTPGLLFPAITLLLLAYTNRFLAVATLIRSLHKQHLEDRDQSVIIRQIKNLRSRINMIKNMQAFGMLSFLMDVLTMLMLFQEEIVIANYTFGTSLLFLMTSLAISLREIQISTRALNMELSDMESL